MAKKKLIECVTVKYDLADLPTAQHKAGLAGLVLQIRHLGRDELKIPSVEIPVIEELTATTCTIRFTSASTQRLFNELYDAAPCEIRSKSKWNGTEPLREDLTEEPDGKGGTKRVKWFIYEVTQPTGGFLRTHLPEMNPAHDYHKLWRDMLWTIPRGNPQSRTPYDQRAADQPCTEGHGAWEDLVRFEQARDKATVRTAPVASSLWLGAQAVNAESIPFIGRVEENLLLHFWQLTVLVFVPQVIDNDGESDFVGYSLAIPEVSHLEYFCDDYPEMLHSLPTEVRGFRPAGAVIDLPAQAALELMECLALLAQHSIQRKGLASINAVEFLHLVKSGNNIKSMASGRIAPQPFLLNRYLTIVGSASNRPFRNPLFRTGLLRSLLRGQRCPTPWYEPFGPELAERPWPFFIRTADSPRTLPWFWTDAAKQFENEEIEFRGNLETHRMTAHDNPSAAAPKPDLALLIHRLVRTYIQRRTTARCGLEWDDIKVKKKTDEQGRERIDVPQAYTDAREKAASELFLGMRSRREDDFVRFFTDTVCSCKQFLPESDFVIVANALLTEPENVKTIAMLATSANS